MLALGVDLKRARLVENNRGDPGDRRADRRLPREPDLGCGHRLSPEGLAKSTRRDLSGWNHLPVAFYILGAVYHSPPRFLLASASPRRHELLTRAGYVFDVVPADVDESRRVGESARDYVRRLARAKAEAVTRVPDQAVLGADTVVVIDGEVLGKPRDGEDAAAMLRRLSGRTHDVLTGVALVWNDTRFDAVETTEVTLVDLDNETIRWYVATGEPADKAGAYGVQGIASRFVSRVAGSYTNVVGLPVTVVARLFADLGRLSRSASEA